MIFLIIVFSFLEITAILLGIAIGRAVTNRFIKQNRKNEYQDKVIDLFMKIIVEDIRSNNVEALEYTAEWLKVLQMHAEWHREWYRTKIMKIKIEEVKHEQNSIL